ncbi:MAG TPA: hypothetical protein VFY73_09045 [Ideonella sp.]|uniref:DUF6929 family protein n=1 Tax=Ideonella sp. TaxID=1929293 RepID=UPI002E3482CA|nr:hypothetical protein [Ideonella sp.]HEX5684169.1 hypothetical protein [Ideonella sp.]
MKTVKPVMRRDHVLPVEVLRELRIASAGSGLDHLSAASGLAVVGDHLYVVADDEHSLGQFHLVDGGPGRLLTLFDEALPSHHGERKALKADLEALTVLPELAGYPNGALFVAGSGSKPNRRRGALLSLDVRGVVTGAARPVDLTAIHGPLQHQLGALNIEGLFVSAGALCLLQRGSKVSPTNACVRFDLGEFGKWLTQGGPAPQPTSITGYDLGSVSGVPMTFTDGAALPDGGWVFCAAAEDTDDSYHDGACAGSAVGVVDACGTLHGPFVTAAPAKVEGIAIDPHGAPGAILLVTDADDRQMPGSLLKASLTHVMHFPLPTAVRHERGLMPTNHGASSRSSRDT